MNRNLLILLVIALSIVGVGFIVFAIISNANKEPVEEEIQQQEEQQQEEPIISEAEIQNSIIQETNSLKMIADNYKMANQTLEGIYDYEEFVNKIHTIKDYGDVAITTNLGEGSANYCVVTTYKGTLYCVDDTYSGYVVENYCALADATCEQQMTEEPVVEEPEPIELLVIPENPIEEEPEEVIPEEPIVPEEPEIETLEEISVAGTTLKRVKDSEGMEYVFIDEEEFGPYSESYIETSDDISWGIGCKYEGQWYVNIDNKVYGPYENKPSIEIFGEDLGFSYEDDGEYYVNIGGEVYGPYDDLLDFQL